MSGFELLGAQEIGEDFNWGGLLKTAGDLGSGAIEVYQAHEAGEKTKRDELAKVDAAKAADSAAAIALAQSLTSEALAKTSPAAQKADAQRKAATDKAAADAALVLADRLGPGLSPDGQAARLAAVQKALAAAQAKPSGPYNDNLVKAWSNIATRAQNAQIVTSDAPASSSSTKGGKGKGGKGKGEDDKGAAGESFWTRKVIGPIPGWGVAAGGTGAAAGLLYLFRRVLFR